MKRLHLLLLYSLWISIPLTTNAQIKTDPTVGLRDNTPNIHAFINARIVPRPGEVIEKGTLVVRNGVIEAVGDMIEPPADARIWDVDGMTVYPGLIETYTHAGVKNNPDASDEGRYWNIHVRPERTVTDYLDADSSEFGDLRKLGFTSAHVVPNKGVIRGQSALISLADTTLQERLIRDRIAQHIVFQRQGESREPYPNSLTGVIALIRQTMYDAQWYGKAHERYNQNPEQENPEINISLAALQDVINGNQPIMFSTWDDQSVLRAKAIVREFNVNAWYGGSGYEYRTIQNYTDINTPIPISLNFPKTPDLKTWEETLDVSLVALRHWERAASNPSVLAEENIPFTLTTFNLSNTSDFPEQIQQAVKQGLSKETLLASLTTVPAEMLGVDSQLGTLQQGKRGQFIITDGELFEKDTKVMDVWIDGNRYEINPKHEVDPRGSWSVKLPEEVTASLSKVIEIKGDLPKISASIIFDGSSEKAKWIELDHDRISFTVASEHLEDDGVYQFTGIINKKLISGYANTPTGKSYGWTAEWLDNVEDKKKDDDDKDKDDSPTEYISRIVQPPVAYGFEELPQQKEVIFISNATVWTNGPDGILEIADVLIVKGVVQNVGVGLEAPDNAFVIDGTGKHVTSGLIDPHSHTAIESGVNETGQAITAEPVPPISGGINRRATPAWFCQSNGRSKRDHQTALGS
jgi:imidazolonepropionase-like amidohydrolase